MTITLKDIDDDAIVHNLFGAEIAIHSDDPKQFVIMCHDDPDGWLSAYLIRNYLVRADDTSQTIYCHYGMPFEEPIDDGCIVVVVDFSFSLEEMTLLARHGKHLIYIDHHANSINFAKELQVNTMQYPDANVTTVVTADKHSACMLAYFFTHLTTELVDLGEDGWNPSPLLEAVNAYDQWSPELFENNMRLLSRVMAFEYWHDKRFFGKDDEGHEFNSELFLDLSVAQGYSAVVGQPLLATALKRCYKHLGNAVRLTIPWPSTQNPTTILAVPNVGGADVNLVAHLGHRAGPHGAGEQVVVCFQMRKTNVKYSIRSQQVAHGGQSLDVGEYARWRGGGGHRTAAGWTTPYDDFGSVLRDYVSHAAGSPTV